MNWPDKSMQQGLPMPEWAAFNWEVQTIDGHDMTALVGALRNAREKNGKPKLILANTVKGKGVSFMEKQIGWHGVTPKADQAESARQEIQKLIENL